MRPRLTPLESIPNEEEKMEVSKENTDCGHPAVLPSFSLENPDGEVFSPDISVDEDYTIATHFVKVRRSGTLADVTTLWDLVGTEAVSGSLEDILDKPGFDRLPSINAFDKVL